MKKYIVVPAVLTLLLAGCAGAIEPGGSGTSGKPTVTIVGGVANEEFYVTMACGAQEAADELGVELDVQAGERWDPAVQTEIVNAIISTTPDALIIAPNDRTAMLPPLQTAADAGINIVVVDTGLDENTFTVSHIASDNVEGAAAAADTLAQLVGEEGKVLIVGGTPGVTTSEQRSEGFNEAMKKYPNITVLDQQFTVNSGIEEAASQMSAVIAAHPDVAGVFALALISGEGVAAALQQNGLAGEVKVVAFDAGPGQVEALRDGTLDALVAQKPREIGRQAVEQALKAINGEPTTAEIKPGFVSLTKDNIDDPENQQWLYKGTCE